MPELVQSVPASFSKSTLGFSPSHLSISEPIPKAQFQLRSPSQRRRRSSDSRFPITPPPNSTDARCKKGVKFSNLDDENRRPPRIESYNAKTSEYAFFKKLKEDASHNHHSCSKSKEAYRGSDAKPRDGSRERTNIGRNKCDAVESAVLHKDVIPEALSFGGDASYEIFKLTSLL